MESKEYKKDVRIYELISMMFKIIAGKQQLLVDSPLPQVYLCGGMRSNWQDAVIKSVEDPHEERCGFFDPRDKREEAMSTREIVDQDLAWIDRCDVVFAYLEESNPYGANLAMEIGYAKAKGKYIIFVDEKELREFMMARESADKLFSSFEEGIKWFQNLIYEYTIVFKGEK